MFEYQSRRPGVPVTYLLTAGLSCLAPDGGDVDGTISLKGLLYILIHDQYPPRLNYRSLDR